MGKDEGWLLAIDLTGPGGLVVLGGRGGLFSRTLEGGGGTRFLLTSAAEMMEAAGITPRHLGLLGVARGPGSFTGIRMAVTAVKALAEVLDLPVAAPDSLAARAVGPEGAENVFVALDARRGELYYALFRMEGDGAFRFPVPVVEPRVDEPGVAARFLEERGAALRGDLLLVGNGVEAYPDLWPAEAYRADRWGPLPAALAWLCRELEARGTTADHFSLLPLYLRRPDVGGVRDA